MPNERRYYILSTCCVLSNVLDTFILNACDHLVNEDLLIPFVEKKIEVTKRKDLTNNVLDCVGYNL